MSPESLVPAIVLFCLAMGETYLLLRLIKIDVPKDKFVPIDGLRGVLAFCVFLHHSVIWYYCLRTGKWGGPPSRVYGHFGPGSVAMFFMITAFLFYGKLLDARIKGMDWGKLYMGRVRRIMPLYIFVILLVFIIVGVLSGFVLHTNLLHIMVQLTKWVFFIDADVNGVWGTKRIGAGVVWSLAYEWLFYCSLAIVGRVVYRIRTSVRVLIFSGLFFLLFLAIVWVYYPDSMLKRILCFAGGIAAAYLVRKDSVRKFCTRKWASAVVLALTGVVFFPDMTYPTIFSTVISFICMSLAFIMIAAGTDVFGLLSNRLTRYLGMVSYSLYLLHGMVLFVCFRWIIGPEKAAAFSPEEYWVAIGGCALTLVPLCSLTYYYIEKVGVRKKARATVVAAAQ
ncbi:MAG TPA: acyltransferase, partial [Puia sp.]|nr:acyltransferase [Puia sp.]